MKKLPLLLLLFTIMFSTIQANEITNFNSYDFKENTVIISKLIHLPNPDAEGKITLDGTKSYIISGMVDIKDYYIDLNGAGFTGVDPGKDGIISSTNGAVLRSFENYVYLRSVAVICNSVETKAYEFIDNSGTKACNLFNSTSVIDAPGITSKGVGLISGFETTCINLNLWDTADGLKISGKMKKLTLTSIYIKGIQNTGIEINDDAKIDDVIITSCYFTYQGGTGIKVNLGSFIDQGRLGHSFFKGPTRQLLGFDSFSAGWEMSNNGLEIPDSKGKGYIYFNDNLEETILTKNEYSKINGVTLPLKLNKFMSIENNKLVYLGRKLTNLEVTATATSISKFSDGSYSLVLRKNGTEIILPKATASNIPKGRSFYIRLDSQVELVTGDYIELCIKLNSENNNGSSIIVSDMQVKIYEQ